MKMKPPRNIIILRHMPHEAGGTLESALIQAGFNFHYYDLYRETPDRLPLERTTGLVVLGGPMNVDQVEKFPFLLRDVEWIRQALAMQMPILGICLGSQLLAKSLGAKVFPNHVKEIGWYPVEWTPAAADDPLFRSEGAPVLFQWHGDTFDLPADAVHLAESVLCKNQAFRYGSNVYGLQFHIEMTRAMIHDWLENADNRREIAALGYIDPDRIREETPRRLPALQTLAANVFGRFAAMCRDFR